MTRVRGFTQDDAHLFCTDEQVADEFRGCIEMTQFVLEDAGPGQLPRAARLPRSGQRQVRRRARSLGPGRERARRRLHASWNLTAHAGAGRGGVLRPEGRLRRDRLHRPRVAARHRAARLQPAQAERFELEYVGADNHAHRPVMIHRAPLGSMERFIGVLIEHFAGAFPLWLAPEQVRVLTVSEKSEEYGRAGRAAARARPGFRVTGDYRPEKLGAKIRDAQLS